MLHFALLICLHCPPPLPCVPSEWVFRGMAKAGSSTLDEDEFLIGAYRRSQRRQQSPSCGPAPFLLSLFASPLPGLGCIIENPPAPINDTWKELHAKFIFRVRCEELTCSCAGRRLLLLSSNHGCNSQAFDLDGDGVLNEGEIDRLANDLVCTFKLSGVGFAAAGVSPNPSTSL